MQKLNQQGLSGKFRFVGTQRSSCSGIGNNGGHEGYPAFKATASPRGPKGKIGGIGGEWDDKKQNLLPKVLAKTHPDVVMILLGINDLVFQSWIVRFVWLTTLTDFRWSACKNRLCILRIC